MATRNVHSLAISGGNGYRRRVAAKSAIECGSSNRQRRNSAQTTTASAFFASAVQCYGSCALEALCLPDSFVSGLPHRRTAATLHVEVKAAAPTDKGASPMITISPSNTRAAAHRAMAMAALHANSSLAVRLRRYNHHMDIARTLESAESR